MKILFILHSSSKFGGPNKSLFSVLGHLISAGITPYIVLPGRGSVIDEINLLHIPFKVVTYYPSVYPNFDSFKNLLYFSGEVSNPLDFDS